MVILTYAMQFNPSQVDRLIEHSQAVSPTQPADDVTSRKMCDGRRAPLFGLPAPFTPPMAPAPDSSPQTASDANTDTPASGHSPYPASPPARPSISTPLPVNSAEAVLRFAPQLRRCLPSDAATTNSTLQLVPVSQPLSTLLPAHPQPCTNIRPQPAARNPPSCAVGSLSEGVSRARSSRSDVPIPGGSTQSCPRVDRSPAASIPTQTPAQSASNTPGAQRTASSHTDPPPPATSSNASPKNSNTRCSAPFRSAPTHPASASFLPPAPSHQTRACGRCRCSRCPAAAGSRRKPSASESATTRRR